MLTTTRMIMSSNDRLTFEILVGSNYVTSSGTRVAKLLPSHAGSQGTYISSQYSVLDVPHLTLQNSCFVIQKGQALLPVGKNTRGSSFHLLASRYETAGRSAREFGTLVSEPISGAQGRCEVIMYVIGLPLPLAHLHHCPQSL